MSIFKSTKKPSGKKSIVSTTQFSETTNRHILALQPWIGNQWPTIITSLGAILIFQHHLREVG
jgi:hypothetical protein